MLSEFPEMLQCMTLHPGLEPVCLNPWALRNALRLYEAEHGRLSLKKRAAYVTSSNIYLEYTILLSNGTHALETYGPNKNVI